MTILLVNGSPHAHGNTSIALAEVAKGLIEQGLKVDNFWIGTKPIRGCIACGGCFKAGKCVFDDDNANRLSERLSKADGIVVGSPTYFGQPNGSLLAMLQRAFFSGRAHITGKPAACVAVSRRGGVTANFQCLNLPFQMLNCPMIGSQYWNIGFGRAPGEIKQDGEGLQTMRTLRRNMAWVVKNLKNGQPRPDPEEGIVTHFIR